MKGFRIQGGAADDSNGYSVSAAGDVNGDGVSDVIVGSYAAASPPSGAGTGISYVIFGRSVTYQINNPFGDIQLTTGTTPLPPSVGFRILGAATGDQSGQCVSSAGDVNGDNIDDVIVGAYGADISGALTTGISYVIFGRNLSAGADAFGDIQLTAGASPMLESIGFRIIGAAAEDFSGYSVSAAGDLNSDGVDDILIGSYRADSPGGVNAGITYVIFGRSLVTQDSHPFGDVQLTTGTNVMATNVGFRILGAVANDWSGYCVSAAGDVSGDNIDDFIIGANQASTPGGSSAGISYVIFGRNIAGGALPFNDIQLTAATMAESIGFRILGAATSDDSGQSVSAAGDVNGDGVGDIIIGAYGADPPGANHGGISYVIFGRKLAAPGVIPFGDIQLTTGATTLSASIGFRILGAAANDNSGFSVGAAGDVNGDGIDDVIVGAFAADPPSGSVAGISYVIFGRNLGSVGATPFGDIQLTTGPTALSANTGFRVLGAAAVDQSGYSVSYAGDVNSDGLADIIIGANGADTPTGIGAGTSYVVYGVNLQPTSQPSPQPSGQPSMQPTSEPSSQPLNLPTQQPSNQPTRQPTTQPSLQPSCQPAAQPTSTPSVQPTSEPSASPTLQPSVQPTLPPSAQPSSNPSAQPSRGPTAQSSAQPSGQPSLQPRVRPTTQPTSQPSMQPSEQPTAHPTLQPLTQPSVKPTSQPSFVPSCTPSSTPSVGPSTQPSSQPSRPPSTQPSCRPSTQPSAQPSAQHSGQPSTHPSQQPSTQPWSRPSAQPTSNPSTQPFSLPTGAPSVAPSAQPTGMPLVQPSTRPTSLPSTLPTTNPTLQPSAPPSTQPTVLPLSVPTEGTTSQPSTKLSSLPLVQPNTNPSPIPSSKPSPAPSIHPIAIPSVQPSHQITAHPSFTPHTTGRVVSGEWTVVLNNTVETGALTYMNGTVWTCGTSGNASFVSTCYRIDPTLGIQLVHFLLPWITVSSILLNDDASRLTFSGLTSTNGVVSANIATCFVSSTPMICTAKLFADTSFAAGSFVPAAKMMVYIGSYNDQATATMRGDAHSAVRSYIYSSNIIGKMEFLHAQSPPNYFGSFIAGTCSSASLVTYICAGVVRSDSGMMSAMYIAPANEKILSSVELVNTMVLEYANPDSFIAGGLQTSDDTGMHAYLLRVNSLYYSVLYGVRYRMNQVLPHYRRKLYETQSASSVVRGMVLVDKELYMVLDYTALWDITSRVAILKVHTTGRQILKQVQICSSDGSVRCSDIAFTGLTFTISCKEWLPSNKSRVLLLSMDRALTLSRLPSRFKKYENDTFLTESVVFHRTVLPLTMKSADRLLSDYTFTTTTDSSTHRADMYPIPKPTSAPACQPSSCPTTAPTLTLQPTSHPSTSGPTNTYKPTFKPTIFPSAVPSKQPTLRPSVDPTVATTIRTSVVPTVTNSIQPTAVPTVLRTRCPTTKATKPPTMQTTDLATHGPTTTPTIPNTEEQSSKADTDRSFLIVGFMVVGLFGIWLLYYSRFWCLYKLERVQSDANRTMYVISMGEKPKPRFPICAYIVSFCVTIEPVEVGFVDVEDLAIANPAVCKKGANVESNKTRDASVGTNGVTVNPQRKEQYDQLTSIAVINTSTNTNNAIIVLRTHAMDQHSSDVASNASSHQSWCLSEESSYISE